MRGLRLYLAPFAPDTSGAAAVFFPLDCLLVILDAGGCAGNICAFDEPRWEEKGAARRRSKVFSAALRDMDAILGRDEKFLAKLRAATEEISAEFIAIVGTPVPSVIGTDLASLKRMAAKQTGLATITAEADGTKFYDVGIHKALTALVDKFAPGGNERQTVKGTVALWGGTPLDLSPDDMQRIKDGLRRDGWQKIVYCGATAANLRDVFGAERNLALSAAGIDTVRRLSERYGTPYGIYAPPRLDNILTVNRTQLSDAWTKILIMHEEVTMNGLRRELKARLPQAEIICGGWFMRHKEYTEPQDVSFTEEDEWQDYVRRGNFDCIFADKTFQKAVSFYDGVWIDLPHYAVSGSR